MRNYLHLGDEVVLPATFIVGIFSLAGNGVFIEAGAKANLLRNSGEKNRSFVICAAAGRNTVYLSKISSKKLQKRIIDPQGGIDGQEE